MAEFRERPSTPADVAAYWAARKDNLLYSFDHRDVFAAEHAQGFTVAKAMKQDVLVALRDAVDQAISNGVPYEQFAKELTPTLQKLGWWGKSVTRDPVTSETVVAQLGSPRRLKTIYDSNMRAARTAGFWQRAQRTKRVLPYLVYEIGPSERRRPLHLAQQGKIYPVDHPYWNYWLGPNGWGCKCWARQIGRAEAEQLGGVSPEPVHDMRTYTNKRTGKQIEMPRGVDPGWHINPGKSHLNFVQAGKKLDESLLKAASIGVEEAKLRLARREVVTGFLASPALQNVEARAPDFDRKLHSTDNLELGRIAAPIALLPDSVRETMSVSQSVVRLSVHTLAKQIAKGNEQGRDNWPALQSLLENGRLMQEQKPRHWIISGQHEGRWYRAILKVTQSGDEIYLQSLRRDKPAQRAREFGDEE